MLYLSTLFPRRPALDPGLTPISRMTTAWRTASPAARRSKPSLRSSSGERCGQQPATRQPALAVQLDEARDVARGHAGAEVGALQRALLGDQGDGRDVEQLARVREADGDRRAAAPRRLVGLGQDARRCRPSRSTLSAPPPVSLADRLDGALAGVDRGVAPSSRASSSFSGDDVDGDDRPGAGQTRAEQRREADAAEAEDGDAVVRARPCALLTAAPTPVSTAQPNSAAISKGSSGSTLTAECAETTTWSAKARDAEVVVDVLGRRRAERRSPLSSVPAALAAAPGSQSAGAAAPGTARSRRRRARRRARRGRRARSPASRPAGLDDLAGRLVAEDHRHHARPRAVDDRQVGVAEAGGADADQQLARAGRRRAPARRSPAAATRRRAWAAPSPAGRRRGPSSPAAPRQALEDRASGIRHRAGGRVSRSTKTWTNQPGRRGARRAPSREEADLVADAASCQLPDAQPGLDRLGEGERRPSKCSATRRRRRSRRRRWMSSPPSLDQPAVDDGVEERVVLDVVDVAVDVVVVPPRRDRHPVRVALPARCGRVRRRSAHRRVPATRRASPRA